MKKALFYLYFLLLPLGLQAQGDCPLFKTYIDKGEAELKKGNKADIKKAIEAFTNAMVHCPAKAAEARNKIVKAFDAINALKTQAEKNASLAKKAQKATEDALAKAQATLDKIYFYDGKFGLAYANGIYGFIDKNLQTKIDFKYTEAFSFDDDGWAKVKRDSVAYLIDTTGTEYTLATDLNQLNTTITALDLRGKNLSEIPKDIFEQTQLKILLLSNNHLKKLEGLEHLKALKTLEVSGNQISKLEGLDKLASLQTLNISRNNISKLEGLDKLTALKTLEISGNQISKLEGLEHLKALQNFDISWNQLSKLEGLGNLTALQNFDISWNQISKLEGLEHLKVLYELSISGNQLSKIEGLDNLTALQKLIIWGNLNKLEGLDNLTKLTALQILDISNVQISQEDEEKLKKRLPKCEIRRVSY